MVCALFVVLELIVPRMAPWHVRCALLASTATLARAHAPCVLLIPSPAQKVLASHRVLVFRVMQVQGEQIAQSALLGSTAPRVVHAIVYSVLLAATAPSKAPLAVPSAPRIHSVWSEAMNSRIACVTADIPAWGSASLAQQDPSRLLVVPAGVRHAILESTMEKRDPLRARHVHLTTPRQLARLDRSIACVRRDMNRARQPKTNAPRAFQDRTKRMWDRMSVFPVQLENIQTLTLLFRVAAVLSIPIPRQEAVRRPVANAMLDTKALTVGIA